MTSYQNKTLHSIENKETFKTNFLIKFYLQIDNYTTSQVIRLDFINKIP